MSYTSRGLRRRRGTDKWEVKLSHTDPMTGKMIPSYHTIEAKTEAQARKKRDQLIRDLNDKGSAASSVITVCEPLDAFIDHKEKTGSVEPSTVYHYRKDARVACRYIGDVRVADLTIPAVDDWIAEMVDDGLMPRTIAKPFRLLKQAMKYAVAIDLVTKNPCDYCKPPKIGRKRPPHLSREERTRMREFGVRACDPYILGTQVPDSKPYQPTHLGCEFQTFCRMNGFEGRSFHDLRHTFATMLISDGVDVRTVSSYLGHANVAITLNTYAEEDPEAKRAAVPRIQGAFDIEDSPAFESPSQQPAPGITFTVEQLEAMLAEARKIENALMNQPG